MPTSHRRLVPLCLILATLLLSGCFTFDTLIHLRPDGSGTVEEVFMLQGPMLEMLTMFAEESDEPFEFYTEDELHAHAAEMGVGVRFVAVERLNQNGAQGYRARYTFDDINTLVVNQNPGSQMPMEADVDAAAPPPPEANITFTYTPANPAQLHIRMPTEAMVAAPDDDTIDDTPPPDSLAQVQQLAMMREMLQGGRVRLALQVEQPIRETDASHQDGQTITLVNVDFDELLKADDQILRLSEAKPNTFEDVKALLEGVPGIAMEMKDEVTIQF